MKAIQIHTDLRNSSKLHEAAERVNISEERILGHLVMLWLWAIDHAPNGRLPYDKLGSRQACDTDQHIAVAAGWMEDPARFASAIAKAGFLKVQGDAIQIDTDFVRFYRE